MRNNRTIRRKKPRKKEHSANSAYERIRYLRLQLDAGRIERSDFNLLLEKETERNEWASRVQLQSIARDLLPIAAAQARKGKSRLLAVVGNILLKTEITDISDPEAATAATAISREIWPQLSDTNAGPLQTTR